MLATASSGTPGIQDVGCWAQVITLGGSRAYGLSTMKYFTFDLWRGNGLLGAFASERSLGSVRSGSFARNLPTMTFRWGRSLAGFRVGAYARDLPLGSFRVEDFACDL